MWKCSLGFVYVWSSAPFVSVPAAGVYVLVDAPPLAELPTELGGAPAECTAGPLEPVALVVEQEQSRRQSADASRPARQAVMRGCIPVSLPGLPPVHAWRPNRECRRIHERRPGAAFGETACGRPGLSVRGGRDCGPCYWVAKISASPTQVVAGLTLTT
jgi:hypothetical protein